MKKALTTLLALLLCAVSASAYDFSVNYNGQKLYFSELPNANTLELTSGDYGHKYSGELVIPESVQYVSTTYSVTSIGDNAFWKCDNLTSVTIPNSVTSIGSNAFYGCSSLTSATLPNSVKSIDDGTFSGCSSLGSVTIPNTVTSIGSYAFYGCSSLGSVTIPNSVTSIGSRAFEDCSGLTTINIPNTVTSIGVGAFCSCSSLTSIAIPNSVTSIKDYTFSGCTGLTSVVIPNSVTTIGNLAFCLCNSLPSVTIPNSVTAIGDSSFEDCSSLASLTIPNSVTTFGNFAFSGCRALTSLTIPPSVTSIGDYAFNQCNSLSMLFVKIDDLSKIDIGGALFNGVSVSSATLYVPIGSKEQYANAEQWREFGNIEEKEMVNGNHLYSEGASGLRGQAIQLEVGLANDDDVCAFQCDVVVPKDGSVNSFVSSDRFDNSHNWTVSNINSKTIRMICYSPENTLFSGYDGVLFTITFVADAAGTYEVLITNIELTKPDETRIKIGNLTIAVEVADYIPGDANGDGKVTVSDVVSIVSHILQQPTPNFVEGAADVNGDGDISVTDVVAAVNIILTGAN